MWDTASRPNRADTLTLLYGLTGGTFYGPKVSNGTPILGVIGFCAPRLPWRPRRHARNTYTVLFPNVHAAPSRTKIRQYGGRLRPTVTTSKAVPLSLTARPRPRKIVRPLPVGTPALNGPLRHTLHLPLGPWSEAVPSLLPLKVAARLGNALFYFFKDFEHMFNSFYAILSLSFFFLLR